MRRLIGIDIGDASIVALLERAGLTVATTGDGLRVTPPSHRFDIQIEEDLVEEVARLHGYDNIPSVPPMGTMAMLPRPEAQRPIWTLRHAMVGRDYQEVINYAFIDEAWERDFCANADPIRLANPIASQMSVMRSSLVPGLVATMVANRKRQQARVRVFESGRCFERKADGEPVSGYHQPLRFAALASGPALPEQWGAPARSVDFYDVKGDLESLFPHGELAFAVVSHPALHPGRAASVSLGGRHIGIIGELHPVWVQRYELGTAPVVFEIELDVALARVVPLYRELSRFPVVSRDLALIVDASVPASRVQAVLCEDASPLVRSIELFDVYHGKGIDPDKKSLAFRVLMQDTQRTLEDAEVDAAVAAIVSHAEKHIGARLRG